jgi:hypothetical protein
MVTKTRNSAAKGLLNFDFTTADDKTIKELFPLQPGKGNLPPPRSKRKTVTDLSEWRSLSTQDQAKLWLTEKEILEKGILPPPWSYQKDTTTLRQWKSLSSISQASVWFSDATNKPTSNDAVLGRALWKDKDSLYVTLVQKHWKTYSQLPTNDPKESRRHFIQEHIITVLEERGSRFFLAQEGDHDDEFPCYKQLFLEHSKDKKVIFAKIQQALRNEIRHHQHRHHHGAKNTMRRAVPKVGGAVRIKSTKTPSKGDTPAKGDTPSKGNTPSKGDAPSKQAAKMSGGGEVVPIKPSIVSSKGDNDVGKDGVQKNCGDMHHIVPTAKDVIFGPGRKFVPGSSQKNSLYWTLIEKCSEDYNAIPKEERKQGRGAFMREKIIDAILDQGGRFLLLFRDTNSSNCRYCELSVADVEDLRSIKDRIRRDLKATYNKSNHQMASPNHDDEEERMDAIHKTGPPSGGKGSNGIHEDNLNVATFHHHETKIHDIMTTTATTVRDETIAVAHRKEKLIKKIKQNKKKESAVKRGSQTSAATPIIPTESDVIIGRGSQKGSVARKGSLYRELIQRHGEIYNKLSKPSERREFAKNHIIRVLDTHGVRFLRVLETRCSYTQLFPKNETDMTRIQAKIHRSMEYERRRQKSLQGAESQEERIDPAAVNKYTEEEEKKALQASNYGHYWEGDESISYGILDGNGTHKVESVEYLEQKWNNEEKKEERTPLEAKNQHERDSEEERLVEQPKNKKGKPLPEARYGGREKDVSYCCWEGNLFIDQDLEVDSFEWLDSLFSSSSGVVGGDQPSMYLLASQDDVPCLENENAIFTQSLLTESDESWTKNEAVATFSDLAL